MRSFVVAHRHVACAAIVLTLAATAAQASDKRPKSESSWSDFFHALVSPPPPPPARPRPHHRAHRPVAPSAVTEKAVAPPTPAPERAARVLVLSPKAAERADITHSALVLTRKRYAANLSFAGRLQTVKQLRTGSAPNPWECGWIVWSYQDSEHFYYLALKPNGWELGKRDPAYPGGQRFLASGRTEFPIGSWHRFAVTQDGGRLTVHLDGARIAAFTDTERPYTGGALGFYAEDAEIAIDGITAPFAESFNAYPAKTISADGAVMRNWVAPFLGYGFLAIDDRKR